MHIVFLIDQVYSHGGIERVLSIKANYLAVQPGYQISIITTEQNGKEACYSFDAKIDFHDIGINYQRNRSYFHPANLVKLPSHLLRLKKIIKKLQPDFIVVCSHSTDTYFVPLLFRSTPTIKEFHFSRFIEKHIREGYWFKPKRLFLIFADYIERKYDRLVVLNQDEASFYRSDNITVIPNPATFNPEPKDIVRRNIVIAAGRIAIVKGFERLIEAWSKIASAIPDWELHIYGDGDPNYTDKLLDFVRGYNLEGKVRFMGKSSEIQEHMQAASIYAMTSHNECFPLVLLEAQACGLPVIAFDCPYGPRNILDQETGLLIPDGDVDAFARETLRLIQNPKKRAMMGLKALENVKKYRISEVMALWTEMFVTLDKKK